MLDQSDYFELLVKFFGCICEAVPNNDVLMFLSMLRSSLVCDTFIPLWFSENVSTNVLLIFNRLPEIVRQDWDKLLLNWFCGVILSFEMLLLLEGEGLIMVSLSIVWLLTLVHGLSNY